MIIHYNYDPRCTRRARPGVLLKGCPLVWYHAPVGRWALYGRAYVIPRNPRTPPQVRMRNLFGALAKDWFARLTQPQREAWNLYARRIHRRWRPGRPFPAALSNYETMWLLRLSPCQSRLCSSVSTVCQQCVDGMWRG